MDHHHLIPEPVPTRLERAAWLLIKAGVPVLVFGGIYLAYSWHLWLTAAP